MTFEAWKMERWLLISMTFQTSSHPAETSLTRFDLMIIMLLLSSDRQQLTVCWRLLWGRWKPPLSAWLQSSYAGLLSPALTVRTQSSWPGSGDAGWTRCRITAACSHRSSLHQRGPQSLSTNNNKHSTDLNHKHTLTARDRNKHRTEGSQLLFWCQQLFWQHHGIKKLKQEVAIFDWQPKASSLWIFTICEFAPFVPKMRGLAQILILKRLFDKEKTFEQAKKIWGGILCHNATGKCIPIYHTI